MWTLASRLLILLLYLLQEHCALTKTTETPSPSSSSSTPTTPSKDSYDNSQYSTISGIVYSTVFVMIIVVSLIRVWQEQQVKKRARQRQQIAPNVASRSPAALVPPTEQVQHQGGVLIIPKQQVPSIATRPPQRRRTEAVLLQAPEQVVKPLDIPIARMISKPVEVLSINEQFCA